jgi:outer membrane protein OmpA-like peptidoglycan-associated protein
VDTTTMQRRHGRRAAHGRAGTGPASSRSPAPAVALVAALVLVVVSGAVRSAARIEGDLERQSCEALLAADVAGVGVAYSGRDATIADVEDVGRAAAAISALYAVDGTRVVRVGAPDGDRPAPCVPLAAADAAPTTAAGRAGAAAGPVVTALFDSSSADLDRTARSTLDAFLAWHQAHRDVTVRVKGHADATGLDTRNLPLSLQRAGTVREYLVSHGVDGRLVTTEGFGSLQPAAPNTTDIGRRLNRRVDIYAEDAT